MNLESLHRWFSTLAAPSITWRAFKNTFTWAPPPKSLIQLSRVGPRVVFCKSSPNVSDKHPKVTTTSVLLFL